MNTQTKILVDTSVALGPVKPVNGVGQPPMVGSLDSWDMMPYLKNAGIPYSRLHDVGGRLGQGLFVDIPNLFPDFEADETDPANYRFAFTDSLMKALTDNGVEPFFRLGVTIENWVYYRPPLPAVHTKPPRDFAKWGRICEHVIRHYTEGWADGFQMKVEYWEIWNEPEGYCMFAAPFSEFLRLYGTVAPYLKSRFPHLKIGGYGSCGFYAGVDDEFVETADLKPYMKKWLDCALVFLAAARDGGWPLDFFSYHSYAAPAEALRQVRYADRLLDEYGFTRDKTERAFDEWLPEPSLEALGTARQAAAIASELIGLQHSPCDIACLYDARCGVGSYSPLFNPLTLKPHKAYYAFMAFNELRKRGTAVEIRECCASRAPSRQDGSKPAAPGVYSAAAKGADGSIAVMIANINDVSVPFELEIADDSKRTTARITDDTHTWEETVLPSTLPPHSFILVQFA